MADIEEFSHAVAAIYESATDPANWSTALQRLAALFDASVASLISGSGASRTVIATTAPDVVQRDYDEHYHSLDYVIDAVERAPIGLILTGSALVARAENSEFGRDFLHRFDYRTGLFVRLSDDPFAVSLLIAGPHANRASETADAVRTGDWLTPHLRQALRTQRQLADRDRSFAAADGLIDTVRHGVVVVGADRRCGQMNSAAEHTLSTGDGLLVRAGRLGAARSATDQRLTAKLRAATAGVVRTGGSMICERSTGARPYILHIVPISRRDAALTWHRGDSASSALVLIIDPEGRYRTVGCLAWQRVRIDRCRGERRAEGAGRRRACSDRRRFGCFGCNGQDAPAAGLRQDRHSSAG